MSTELAEISNTTASMIQQITRAEIDQQIATAHQFPRSLTKANRNILSLVTISEETARECNYALPRGGKAITGPSIRLAEIVISQWGNCRVGARVVHVDRAEMYVEAEGIFHDLETNSATTARVRRRISGKNGKVYNDDMIITTGNAACSIAKRNAVLAGVPKAIWNEAYEAALRTIRGDQITLPEQREKALTAMAAFGMKPEQVCFLLGVYGEDDIGLDQIVTLRGMHSALKNGEATVEEMLKNVEGDAPEGGGGSQKNWDKKVSNDKKPAPEKKVDAKPKPEAKPKEQDQKSDAKSDDDNTGDGEPDEALIKAQADYNNIQNDLMDATNPDDVLELHSDAIAAMMVAAPDLHARLMDEVTELKGQGDAD